MNADADQRIPAIAPMFRLQYEQAQSCHVLLYPEGMVKLSASAGEIMRRIDGQRSIGVIIAELKAAYAGADLDADVRDFMGQAHERGWITL